MYTKVKGTTPICHIHGSNIKPESIVITDEDYTEFFRAGNYWQSRLAFLAKKHLVLMIGYGFGDSNVTSAIDWCESVYKAETSDEFNYPIYQVHRVEKESGDYRDGPYDYKGVQVIDTNDLESFFQELLAEFKIIEAEEKDKRECVEEYKKLFKNPSEEEVRDVLKDRDNKQTEIIQFLKDLGSEYGDIWPSAQLFFNAVFQQIKGVSHEKKNFDAYNKWTKLLINVLSTIEFRRMTATFFHTVCDSFRDLAPYIEINNCERKGFANAATHIWWEKSVNICEETKQQMYLFFKVNPGKHIGNQCLYRPNDYELI
ncbi:hypothetical protein KIM372_14050 [Bombiscardovia nodaiensis]|uniref:SIR2-like domain-containing protein n=1 Tax=Bombiscardovia nodaiensis TaxID=2932181 RepID=A0ABN6SD90_9BIFI|nr:hypothetical protein KIM372_14050 [Bombiscardovia nodaiensis]